MKGLSQMVEINKEKCTGCGSCVSDCVAGNLSLQDGIALCDGPCILCGHCVAICPKNAVTIPEYDMADVKSYDIEIYGINAYELLNSIKYRRSIRQYADKTVEREKLELIVQAGRYTATGVNRQACRFVVVQDNLAKLKDMIWSGVEHEPEQTDEMTAQMYAALKNFAGMRAQGTDYLFRDAPAVIYVAAESAVDAALAAQNMEMAAVAQGLGMLYNGFLTFATNMNPTAREWLDISDKPVQVCMLAGYPRVTYERTAPRKPADVRWL